MQATQLGNIESCCQLLAISMAVSGGKLPTSVDKTKRLLEFITFKVC